jgi:hypothetical protein
MRSYIINFVVLALATSTFSPALSAPIQYGYGNLLLVELKMLGPGSFPDKWNSSRYAPAIDVVRRIESRSGNPDSESSTARGRSPPRIIITSPSGGSDSPSDSNNSRPPSSLFTVDSRVSTRPTSPDGSATDVSTDSSQGHDIVEPPPDPVPPSTTTTTITPTPTPTPTLAPASAPHHGPG